MVNTKELIGYNLDILNNGTHAILFVICVGILYAAWKRPFITFKKRTTTIVYGKKKSL
jgi:hypothetical protein